MYELYVCVDELYVYKIHEAQMEKNDVARWFSTLQRESYIALLSKGGLSSVQN